VTVDPAFVPLLLAMAGAAFLCRIVGFWAMRFVPPSPRLEAALRATPLAVMAGIVATAVARGGLPEIVAVGAVLLAHRLTGSELVSAFSGIATVAALRALG
jgi:uncharacterized membrane protein